MKELNSFTVERLEEILNFDLPRHPAALAEIVALARIALAAKRAEPFAWKWRGAVGDIWTQEKRKADFVKENCPELPVTELYTTPQLNSPEIPEGWIKCSDQMPENDERKPIAIYTGNCLGQGMFVASYDDDEFFDYWEGTEIKGVTHWMPLPAAPEKQL